MRRLSRREHSRDLVSRPSVTTAGWFQRLALFVVLLSFLYVTWSLNYSLQDAKPEPRQEEGVKLEESRHPPSIPRPPPVVEEAAAASSPYEDLHAELIALERTDDKPALQKVSRELTLRRFGEAPYIVELSLNFGDGQEDVGPGTNPIIRLEMAPLDLMPYTVYWFLSAVDDGLYTGASFIRNARHVVQADPKNARPRWTEAKKNSVAFQEYSPVYPHERLTVGLAGRPGGPDFYISLIDNTRNHGPGGQKGYDAVSEADPCFARLVAGESVLERITKLPVKPGNFNMLAEFVDITEAHVVDVHQ